MTNGEDQVKLDGFKFDKSIVRMAFDAVLALVVGVVGFLVTGLNGEIRDMRLKDTEHAAALTSIRERLPVEYVRMDLYIRDRQEMMGLLREIDRNVREHRERQGVEVTKK
jgi:hypothetical protein